MSRLFLNRLEWAYSSVRNSFFLSETTGIHQMKIFVAVAVFLSFALPAARAQAPLKGLAFTFRTTEQGDTIPSVTTGSGIVARDRLRLDRAPDAQMTKMLAEHLGDSVRVLMADTGTALTISFVGPVKKAYAEMRPMEMARESQAAQAGNPMLAQIAFAGTSVKLDSLGDGGTIAGHATQHFRTTAIINITMKSMGTGPLGHQIVTTDYWLAPDLREFSYVHFITPAYSAQEIPGLPDSIRAKFESTARVLDRGMLLKAEMHTTGAMFGTGVNSHGSLEITDLKPTTVSPAVFAVPPGYSKVSPGGGQ